MAKIETKLEVKSCKSMTNAHYNGILEKKSEREREKGRKEGEKEEKKNGCNVLPKMARVSPQNDVM